MDYLTRLDSTPIRWTPPEGPPVEPGQKLFLIACPVQYLITGVPWTPVHVFAWRGGPFGLVEVVFPSGIHGVYPLYRLSETIPTSEPAKDLQKQEAA